MNFIFRTFLHLKLCIWCNFNKNKWYSHRRPIRGDYRERRLISGIITWLAQPLRHHESDSTFKISCLTHGTKQIVLLKTVLQKDAGAQAGLIFIWGSRELRHPRTFWFTLITFIFKFLTWEGQFKHGLRTVMLVETASIWK